ncbi:CHAT domain-containing protein [Gloeothece verrucosa]|uniref:Tetratricopeptide TPR_2 repeat protein n=1 Tax=Gloeothece verrucosa (strain PCC 7822) TaxID=497965 RepID=E0UEE3_GLOV7|nr:CHAT domain-containing protein [Gloeothece verrucosa]ADN15389.1 Tetratricopeptide TPR_2 repeat protein [Gloeothece verrucosa PCC 7822]
MKSKTFSLRVLLSLLTTFNLSCATLISDPQVSLSENGELAQMTQENKAKTLLEQGMQQLEAGDYQAAIQSFQEALILLRQQNDRQGEGQALKNLGNAYFWLGDYAKALDYGQKALDIARDIGDQDLEARALLNLGNLANELQEYPKANDYYQQSLNLAIKSKNRELQAKVLGSMGQSNYSQGHYDEAIKYLQESLKIAENLSDNKLQVNALIRLGRAYQEKKELTKAIDYYQQSLKIVRELNNPLQERIVLMALGLAYNESRDYDQAIEYSKQGVTIGREIKDPQGESESLYVLGLAYNGKGDYQKVVETYEQALVIVRQLNNPQREVEILNFLGVAYGALGEYLQQINYLKQALTLAKTFSESELEIKALWLLGQAHFNLGDYAAAIKYQKNRLELARKIEDFSQQIEALNGLGDIYYQLDDYEQAVKFYEQGLAISKNQEKYEKVLETLNNLGNVARQKNDYDKAIDYAQQSLDLARKIVNPYEEWKALISLGGTYKYLGDKKAIEYLQQSLAITKKFPTRGQEFLTLEYMGLAYRALGENEKAIEVYQKALVQARAINDRPAKGTILSHLGSAYFESGNLQEAEKILRESINILESIWKVLKKEDIYKISLFERQKDTYLELQQVLIAENKPNEALEISERGRARAYAERLAERLSDSSKTPLTIKAPTLRKIQEIAKQQKATLVEYTVNKNPSELYIWVIQPSGKIDFHRVDLQAKLNQTSLEQLVTDSRESMGVRGRGVEIVIRPGVVEKLNSNLKELHQVLIEPIANLLPSNAQDHVIFIPHSSLFLVPFAALKDNSDKYLIEKHTILTSPSIQVLDLTHKLATSRPQQSLSKDLSPEHILIVGNPTFSNQLQNNLYQLKSLPYAEEEAKKIAELLHTKALIGNEATKTAIIPKLTQARLIHLATHGLLDDFTGTGVPGAIALADQKTDNGLLTSLEILQLKLNADLVVLSACSTGGGRLTGDGVIGLSRSLITAGAKSIIVSLWSISDQSTATLMTEFYQQNQNNPDKAQALRAAMLKTMQQSSYSHPKYWAAFTLIGEAN